MDASKFKKTKIACFSSYFTMSSVFCLPALLFVTFHEMYNISWSLLGTLVLTNFCTQFAIDILFTVFSKKINVEKVLVSMPLLTSLGLAIYALSPTIFPNNVFLGLIIGTVIFSISAGLSEVLLSPIIAAIPSENPQRDMSMLHSLYAFGVLSVVIVSSLFFKFVGTEHWVYLTLFFALLPLISSVLFKIATIPELKSEETKVNADKSKKRTIATALCVLCIFFGGCAEASMSNWISSYMESQLHIDKAVGDILGLALFAVLLGSTRMAYAKRGKNISKTLLIGMTGASICYLVAGLTEQIIPAFIACILTGVFTAMLWPGSLLLLEEKVPNASVGAYALMAAGGDLGASIAPQLLGVVADRSGLQSGMLVCSIFPIIGTVFMIILIRFFKSDSKNKLHQ